MTTGTVDKTNADSLRQLVGASGDMKANRPFIEGDHWQGGEGYIGPLPPKDDVQTYAVAIKEIEDGFTSKDVIGETTDRHKSGVVGREPAFGFTPKNRLKASDPIPPATQALIDEAEAEMTIWWDEHGVHEVVKAVVKDALWAERSVSRIFVPQSRLTLRTFSDGTPDALILSVKTLREALAAIWIEHPDPEASIVYENPDTKERIGVYVHKTTGENPRDIIEATWTDGVTTFIRIFDPDEATANKPPMLAQIKMGGVLTMYQVSRPLLITAAVRQQQRALNLAISMLPRNMITAGFLERIILNAQLPGEWVDPPGDSANKAKIFRPDPFYTGAGTTNALQGTMYTERGPDGQERTRLANPSVTFREPVDPTGAINAAAAHYKMLLEETDQSHILIQGDATASGKSREQARADFISSLSDSVGPTQRLGRWILTSVLGMAEALIGTPGRYTSVLRPTFRCRMDAGPLNSDEMRQKVEAGDAGYLAKQSVQEALGIDDIDAENALIAGQPGANLRIVKDQLDALGKALATGIPPEAALAAIGMEDPTGTIVSGIKAKQAADAAAAKEATQIQKQSALNKNNGPKGPPAKRGASRKPPAPGKKLQP